MRISIEKVKDQALVALAAPAAPAVEARNDANRLLKPRNPDLYYSLYIWSATSSVSNMKTISRLRGH